jgi:hypothetical protein
MLRISGFVPSPLYEFLWRAEEHITEPRRPMMYRSKPKAWAHTHTYTHTHTQTRWEEKLTPNSHISCRAMPCCAHVTLQRTYQDHDTAGHGTVWYVWINLPRVGFLRLPLGVSRLEARIFPVTRGLSRRTQHCRRTEGTQHSMCGRRGAILLGTEVRDWKWLRISCQVLLNREGCK